MCSTRFWGGRINLEFWRCNRLSIADIWLFYGYSDIGNAVVCDSVIDHVSRCFGTLCEGKTMMRKVIVTLCLVVMSIVVASAQSYENVFPSYVPSSGGAWAEVETEAGVCTVVFTNDYIIDTFGFWGDGYNLTNLTRSTISGTAYSATNFPFYGNPTEVSCRLTSMGTLEFYVPYESTTSGTRYMWEDYATSAITNTNIAFVDDTGGSRQNDAYRYTGEERLLILVFCGLVLLVLLKILRRAWCA